ncbi:MAG: DUF2508 family protein [Peptococcaceae bacterium]|nr:DUF2508 family protein [Peptococcaceae bacterium]
MIAKVRQLWQKIVSWCRSKINGLRASNGSRQSSILADEVTRACREWQDAQRLLDFVDPELADYVIYRINAAQSRYEALIIQAKKHNETAWKEPLKPAVGQDNF